MQVCSQTLDQLTNQSPSCISDGGASKKQEMIRAFIGEGTERCRIKVNYVKNNTIIKKKELQ